MRRRLPAKCRKPAERNVDFFIDEYSVSCGACEAMCPQGIDIVHQLEVASEHFE